MAASVLISEFCVGGAGLALWILIRFPTFGPKTISGAAVAVIGAFAVGSIVPFLLQASISAGSRAGAFLALLGLVLPTLVAIFWTAACLLRAFCGLLSGLR
jgi:hypothetical protein